MNCMDPLCTVCIRCCAYSLSHFRLFANPKDCSPPSSSVHGDSPGKSTGLGCCALLQGIFPTQGLNPGLLHFGQMLYRLSHQGIPKLRLTEVEHLVRVIWLAVGLRSSLVDSRFQDLRKVFHSCLCRKRFFFISQESGEGQKGEMEER